MKCPFCSYRDSRVVDSRSVEDGSSIRRRRECPNVSTSMLLPSILIVDGWMFHSLEL